ncbi:hypothetical protein GC163_22795 [bacterium]|nr:hypothetical protein [bacterium]
MSPQRYILVSLLGLVGCVGPEETQFLSIYERNPTVEARSYDWHDPFPDERAGPDTFSRPLAFNEPRTDTRKNIDLRFLQAMHPSAGQPSYAGIPAVPGPAIVGPNGMPIASRPQIPQGYPPSPYPVLVSNPNGLAGVPVVPAY